MSEQEPRSAPSGTGLAVPSGTLYVCGTPIGNLGDITLRATRVLTAASVVAAEDTRHTRQLLNHLGATHAAPRHHEEPAKDARCAPHAVSRVAKARLTSYHEHNKAAKGAELVELLLSGQDVALVTDAGMPGISDPGEDLIRACIDAGVTVIPVPGPTAFATALVVSGLPTTAFYFAGFLPRSAKEIRKALAPLVLLAATLLFYETPHRVAKSLPVLREVLGDRQAALCRELTKLHEEVIRGKLSEIEERLVETPARGELCLVVAPAPRGAAAEAAAGAAAAAVGVPGAGGQPGSVPQVSPLAAFLSARIESGATDKEAVSAAVRELGVARNEAYRAMLSVKEG